MTSESSKTFSPSGYSILFSLYLALNLLLNLINKWALGWLPFPLLLTGSHMFFSFIFLLPIMLGAKMRPRHKSTLKLQWKGLATIGVFLSLNISLNNSALVSMTLSLNQVIRASIPVFTCLLSMLFESKIPAKQEAASLTVLTLGTMIAMWNNSAAGSHSAIALCLAGTVSNAGMMSLSGRLLSEKIDVTQLTFYTAPISLLTILPAFLSKELSQLTEFWRSNAQQCISIILLTSIIAFCYNVVHSLMIQKTSAITTTVVGQIKIVGIMMLSALVLGEKKVFTRSMILGSFLALSGFSWFSYLKILKTETVTDISQSQQSQNLDFASHNDHSLKIFSGLDNSSNEQSEV